MTLSRCPRGFQSHLICDCKPVSPMPPKAATDAFVAVKKSRPSSAVKEG